eukprot:GFYU01015188.1.p1 GENE.GFYU01015188.1~~GFYU01015188.1.p1  ORF type:complete len:529 (+),score=140.53 GFYU01015188.1:48-1634(+)
MLTPMATRVSLLVALLVVGVAAVVVSANSTATANTADSTPRKFWHISDPHLDYQGKEGVYECAWGPPSLYKSALDYMKEVDEQPDFIIVTGDLVHFPAHDSTDLTTKIVHDSIVGFTEEISTRFPNTMVFPTLGNHDYAPSNNFPDPSAERIRWLYDQVGDLWSRWLDAEAVETFKKGGYYQALAAPGLRVVSLNTNYFAYYNTYLQFGGAGREPFEQLEWLESVLADAKTNNERVYIMGHIPAIGQDGGSDLDDWWPLFGNIYVAMMQHYKDVVVTGFFGHEHYDEVRILRTCSYDSAPDPNASSIQYCSGDPFQVIYLAPAMAPCHNPGVRLVHYDSDSKAIVDYQQHATSLDDLRAGKDADFKLLYSPLKEYNMTDLSAPSWKSLVDTMDKDTDLYERFMGIRVSSPTPATNEKGKMWQLCSMAFGTMSEFLKCISNNSYGTRVPATDSAAAASGGGAGASMGPLDWKMLKGRDRLLAEELLKDVARLYGRGTREFTEEDLIYNILGTPNQSVTAVPVASEVRVE